jgi:hypothetical protein
MRESCKTKIFNGREYKYYTTTHLMSNAVNIIDQLTKEGYISAFLGNERTGRIEIYRRRKG